MRCFPPNQRAALPSEGLPTPAPKREHRTSRPGARRKGQSDRKADRASIGGGHPRDAWATTTTNHTTPPNPTPRTPTNTTHVRHHRRSKTTPHQPKTKSTPTPVAYISLSPPGVGAHLPKRRRPPTPRQSNGHARHTGLHCCCSSGLSVLAVWLSEAGFVAPGSSAGWCGVAPVCWWCVGRCRR